MSSYLIKCAACGATTSRAYSLRNGGKCKACTSGIPKEDNRNWKQKHGRCEDAPCCGCCGPQGDGGYEVYESLGQSDY